jgi:cytochrome P450
VATRPDEDHWLRRSGFFHEVVGYAEAVDLLNDPRMHANMVSTFEGLGVTCGLLRDIAAASLLSLNGEEHKRYRSLIAGWFTPRAAERIRPVARDAAHRLLTTFESAGGCEFLTEFAVPYVRKGTCAFAGFPEDDVAACWQALELLASATKNPKDRIEAHEQEVLLALAEYARSALEERRRHPGTDVLTLVADEVTRGSVPEVVALGIIVTLLSAGHDPTINQLAIMVEMLSREPAVWDAVGTGKLSPTKVVEALLRFRSTNQAVTRRVAESFDYRGIRFDEGKTILISLAAANHDPRIFVESDQLDLGAKRTPHLSFGFGPHYCLGAALARVQLQEAIAALTQRLTCPEIVHIVESGGAGLVGPLSLTVSFSRRDSKPHATSRA